ncbi:MAG: hypothetical protein RL386_138 [Bacteroidota bacterium]
MVHISLHTYTQVEKLDHARILTHLHIKEDSHTLYGFADEEERSLFRHLISVSGIGPGTAQIILSAMNPTDIRAAIIGERDDAFRTVKGIGPKTAKRLILDLKDKLSKDGGETLSPPLSPSNNTIREEALSALVALGFNRITVQKTLNQILKDQPAIGSVEPLIKLALRALSS